MSNLHLKDQPELKDFQNYVRSMVEERKFSTTSAEAFQFLLEECGELAKAARQESKHLGNGVHSEIRNIDHEAADVFIFLLDICNKFDIDLESAFRAKEEINKKRWG
jgi:NTP pyrophosphatase (non-canonical NTP hydrolase)